VSLSNALAGGPLRTLLWLGWTRAHRLLPRLGATALHVRHYHRCPTVDARGQQRGFRGAGGLQHSTLSICSGEWRKVVPQHGADAAKLMLLSLLLVMRPREWTRGVGWGGGGHGGHGLPHSHASVTNVRLSGTQRVSGGNRRRETEKKMPDLLRSVVHTHQQHRWTVQGVAWCSKTRHPRAELKAS
jgi:hypothetical protein